MPYDPTAVPRIKTMIPALDEVIGGLAEGAMTVLRASPEMERARSLDNCC